VLSIGWLWTLALFLGTSLVGVWLLKRCGREKLNQFGAALQQHGVRAIHLETPGLAPMIGGILLVFPGFITDVLGALLFVSPWRPWAAAATAADRAATERARPVHQGFLVRESQRPALAGAEGNAALDQHPDQCRRRPVGADRLRGFAQARRQGGTRRHGAVRL